MSYRVDINHPENGYQKIHVEGATALAAVLAAYGPYVRGVYET